MEIDRSPGHKSYVLFVCTLFVDTDRLTTSDFIAHIRLTPCEVDPENHLLDEALMAMVTVTGIEKGTGTETEKGETGIEATDRETAKENVIDEADPLMNGLTETVTAKESVDTERAVGTALTETENTTADDDGSVPATTWKIQ